MIWLSSTRFKNCFHYTSVWRLDRRVWFYQKSVNVNCILHLIVAH